MLCFPGPAPHQACLTSGLALSLWICWPQALLLSFYSIISTETLLTDTSVTSHWYLSLNTNQQYFSQRIWPVCVLFHNWAEGKGRRSRESIFLFLLKKFQDSPTVRNSLVLSLDGGVESEDSGLLQLNVCREPTWRVVCLHLQSVDGVCTHRWCQVPSQQVHIYTSA